MVDQVFTPTQATKKLTSANGQVTWTFPIPYAPGTTPVIHAQVMMANNTVYEIRPVSLSHTQLVLQINYAPPLLVSLVNLLGVPIAAGADVLVHITANKETL